MLLDYLQFLLLLVKINSCIGIFSLEVFNFNTHLTHFGLQTGQGFLSGFRRWNFYSNNLQLGGGGCDERLYLGESGAKTQSSHQDLNSRILE